MKQTELTPLQLWGTAIASAAASRHRALLEIIKVEAANVMPPPMVDAALGASAIMGMNNVYFRFLHLVEHEKYSTLPSKLRMNIQRTHGAPPRDFELWCIAVSAINGCGKCMEAHDRAAREQGVAEETVLAAVRVASVVHAVAVVLDSH